MLRMQRKPSQLRMRNKEVSNSAHKVGPERRDVVRATTVYSTAQYLNYSPKQPRDA